MLLLGACAPPVSAAERFDRSEPDGTVQSVPTRSAVRIITDPSELPSGAARTDLDIVMVPDPQQHLGEDDEPRLVMRWRQVAGDDWFDAEMHADVELRLVRVAPEDGTVPDGEVEPGAPVEFAIDGRVRFDLAATTCEATGARQVCRTTSVVDAAIGGSAVLEGDNLRIEADWGRFGFEASPGVPAATFGRWGTDAPHGSDPFAETTSMALAYGLEMSGLVGGAVTLEAKNGTELNLAASLGVGNGEGRLVLEGF